jgi:serine/threonine-protein kinase
VPSDIEAVVMRCLEKDPARRFQSMDEMLEVMRSANMAAGGHSGIFKRPGGATTGPHPSPQFANSGPHDTNSSTLALDISVEVPEAVAKARQRKLMAMAGLGVGAVVLGLVATVMLMRGKETPPPGPTEPQTAVAAPAPTTPKPAPTEPAETAPQMVRFRLMSEPTGARVYYQGKERGTTPFVLEIPAGGDGTVTAELAFALEGYQTEMVMTGGSGDVVLSQKLQKRRGGAPGSGKVEFATARGSRLEPSAAMPTSLDPAESLAPSPSPQAAKAAPAPAPADDGADTGGPITVPVLAPGVLAAAGNMPIPYGQGMSRPEQLEGKEITYTREALAAKVQGVMLVRCTITKQGKVQNCRVLKPVPHMEATVVEALQSRVYKPIQYKGQIVAVDYVFNIKLQLPRR